MSKKKRKDELDIISADDPRFMDLLKKQKIGNRLAGYKLPKILLTDGLTRLNQVENAAKAAESIFNDPERPMEERLNAIKVFNETVVSFEKLVKLTVALQDRTHKEPATKAGENLPPEWHLETSEAIKPVNAEPVIPAIKSLSDAA